MVKRISILLIILAISLQINAANGKNFVQQKEEIKTVPGQFVVKFKSTNNSNQVSFAQLSMVAAKYNVTSNKQMFSEAKNVKLKRKLNLNNIFVFSTDKGADIKTIVNELNNNPNVEYAEPVYLSKIESTPNDPLFSSLHPLTQIKAPEAWDVQSNSSNVIIGVLDTGVDWDHEDLVNNIWINSGEIADNGIDDDGNGYIDDIRGWDFVHSVSGSDTTSSAADEDGDIADNDPMDYDGHGTHVAGIAGAETNNGIGIASASYGAKIMPLRCGYHAKDGKGYVPSIFAAEAYIYAADNGASVTNQSSGNSGQAILDAAYYAFLNGVLIVESAGNGDAVTPSALGSQPWVISVAAVNQNDVKTYYSSFGEYVDVSSPGGELFADSDTWGFLSTIVNPSPFYGGKLYTKFQGTSMAAPLVASAAALVVANEPTINVVDLFSRIVGTADDIDGLNPNHAGQLGSGRINLHRAVTENVLAKPMFKIVSSVVDDASGNGNGFFDPGENAALKVKLRNVWQNAANVNVELRSDSPWPVSITNATSNIGTVAGVLDTANWEAEATFNITVASDGLPGSIPFQLVITGDGFTQTLNYTIAISPQVLFVADFENSDGKYFDYSKYYTEAFENNSIAYNYVHHLDTKITPELLNMYSTVVWACEWHFPSVDSSDRVALESFLDNGGALFLSGQDVAWDLNENADNIDKEFLNNYLNINFVADNAGRSEISGVDDNPITDGINISFFQKNRDADQQFPDVLEPINNAVSIFNYDNGTSGATSYSGHFDIVFFGFGGFESIDLEENRNEIMKNTIDWLSGINYKVEKLTDTESTTENYTVNFEATSRSSTLSDVFLYWNNSETPPYNKIIMTDNGNGKYSAEIPAQASGGDLLYFVYAESADGNYIMTRVNEFHVGDDSTPPVLELINRPLSNSINIYGPDPYQIHLNLTDNIGIDEATAKIYYTVNDVEPYKSNLLSYLSSNDVFTGSFSFDTPLSVGDKVSYYFAVNDKSANANETKTDVFDYLIDTLQVIDGFEDELTEWDADDEWGLSGKHKSGEFSLSESPLGFYDNNLNITATYKMPFNLTPYKFAKVEFYLSANLERNKDSLLVEVSNDGGISWNKEFEFVKSSRTFKLQTVYLTNYTGDGNNDVRVRFRMVTDSTGQRDGVWIDDVSITASYNVVGVEDEIIIPAKFALNQNYPNPFNPSTIISYSLPSASRVKLQLFNSLGEEVGVLVNTNKNAGVHNFELNASNFASGVYFYRISAESISSSEKFNSVKKMLLIK